MARYVVLRDTNALIRRSETGGIAPPGFEALSIPPQPRIETHDMDTARAHDLSRSADVVAIARAMPTRLIAPQPADGGADPAWGITAVGADTSPCDGAGVRVAVLDTGIDADHPAFAGVSLTQRDFSGDGDGDANGHGTHCAGTILGRDTDGTRIGTAPGVTEALIGKVLGDDGSGSSDMLFDALRWVASEGAQVVSMSLGFDFPGLAQRLVDDDGLPVLLATSIALEGYRANLRMFDRLMEMFAAQAEFDGGTVIVAAAGNESRRGVHPNFEVSVSVPAAAIGVVSVGALGRTAQGLDVADFSNTNPTLSAPGVGIVSAVSGGGLRALDGTSMACPHVAGVAALWWQMMRDAGRPANARAIEARLLASATLAGIAPNVDIADHGQGLVQAPAALVG